MVLFKLIFFMRWTVSHLS